ncbi:hypothetical protein [Sandaracinobacteroides saxicola]|uniref:DUF883 family protein n=1 Tax=Sandaracinobacteroides saxicola TaxID=2759707 RepID=A0A7G5IL46_9SPHN|nr:hypothetical protein [Sandaracinobacteroides saxicola]QMW24088.1 hypothetical protein H3309_06400 [Sandaracinobacteroides saxicola]
MTDTPTSSLTPGGTLGAHTSDVANDVASKARSTVDDLRSEASNLASKAGEKARDWADSGKGKAADALGSAAEATRGVADKLAETRAAPVADFARKAAAGLEDVSATLKEKSVDDLAGDVRSFVKEKPAIAIGVAAVVGFVLARFLKSGGTRD